MDNEEKRRKRKVPYIPDEKIVSLKVKIQQLETYNKKLLAENAKYASESNKLAAENEKLKRELEQDAPTEIVILRQQNQRLRELLKMAEKIIAKNVPIEHSNTYSEIAQWLSLKALEDK